MPMERNEYANIRMLAIPEEIVHQYNLNELVTPIGLLYPEIRKFMPSLNQAD